MSSDRQPPLSLVRHLVVVNLARPLPELIDRALSCLNQALDARAAFYARIDGHSFEIMASDVQSGAPIEPGLRMALEDTFAAVDEEMEGGVLNIRDASKRQPFKSLAMRQRLGITSYLGTSFPAQGEVTGTLGVIGKGPGTGCLGPAWSCGSNAPRRSMSGATPRCWRRRSTRCCTTSSSTPAAPPSSSFACGRRAPIATS